MTRRLLTRSRPLAAPRLGAVAAPVALASITAVGGVLRLSSLHRVGLDPFYDAAVRSMSLSWHNFFFGAFDPSAATAIDKPPADLWLQVISVKLFGFGPVVLKLPEALAGTAAVPILYDAVRRPFGRAAGLGAALTLALLPISVLTSRSDTMDSVMMLLTVCGLWLLIRQFETGQVRWLYLAACAIGVAFNVKLFESLVALPALGVLGLLALVHGAAPLRRAAPHAAGAAALAVVVSLAWLLATLAFPAHERPFAIGSSNGSAWNAAFVFNGVKRIGSSSNEFGAAPTRTPGQRARDNSEVARAAVPISAPRALRLFDHDGPLSGLRLGYVLLAALILGVPGLIAAGLARADDPERRNAAQLRRAAAIAVALWLLVGFVLFTTMTHLHPRYTEAFSPAVAAAVGIGMAWSASAGRRRIPVVLAAAVALAVYSHHLLGTTGVWVLTAAAAAAAAAAAGAALRRPPVVWIAGVALLVTVAALPVGTDASIISHHESDSGHTGSMAPALVHALGNYLRAHRRGARYELAVTESTQASELIVADAQPVLILRSLADHELLSAQQLQADAVAGAVRFAYVGGGCGPHESRKLAVCTPTAAWIRSHGVDVSRDAGLPRPMMLWRLRTR